MSSQDQHFRACAAGAGSSIERIHGSASVSILPEELVNSCSMRQSLPTK